MKPSSPIGICAKKSDGSIKREKFRLNQLAKGAKIYVDMPDHKWHANLDDGSTITMRINQPTPEHAPAVMISVRKSIDNAGIKTQKIHFIEKGNTKWKI